MTILTREQIHALRQAWATNPGSTHYEACWEVHPRCQVVRLLDAYTDLLTRVEELEEERDLAIAHDRQPYPTASAYEQVCAVLERTKQDLASVTVERDDLLAKGDELERQVAELKALKTPDSTFTYCAFCGEQSPMDEHNEDLSAHIKVCSKHPMRDVEADVTRLREALEIAQEYIQGWTSTDVDYGKRGRECQDVKAAITQALAEPEEAR
ncbi:MAG: hypothetical protein LZF86_140005 [Nitrospira sp.]|nr:MAG: hypothetical protein LZF86_140005 [Nitrospira sp.]